MIGQLDDTAVPNGYAVTEEGEHTLVVTATDHAGRTKDTRVTFTIDRTAPAITINNPADGGMYNFAQTFDFDVADADPFVAVTSDPAKGHTWSDEGAYTASVDAKDRADNASAKSVGFMIDLTAPETDAQVVSGTLGANGWWRSAVTVELTASDPEGGEVSSGVNETWYSLDGGATWNKGTSVLISIEGVHEIAYYSIDKARNREATRTFGVKVDTSMPSAEIVLSGAPGASGSGWFVSDVTVAALVTDVVSGPAGWQYRLGDDDPWTDYTGSLVLPHGTWNLQVRPIDIAGNIGGVVTQTVRVDTRAPVTTCTPDRVPDHNGWYTDPVTLTLGPSDSGSGVAATLYSFDGIVWAEYTVPLTISAAGPTSVWYCSVDAAGNREAAGDPYSVKLDLADPE
ncbi:MAG: hypothetical protein Q8K89_01095, partial [Actinomycetota bacterium]|nr:hypothetical protein [Actinomycetota bacterium]